MRDVLERYIRALAERELKDDAPERHQDLGTFVDWLLERNEFTVLLRAYKHSGTARRKSAGRLQLGVDILASKPDPDGVDRLYRFVMKEGPCGRTEWGQGSALGSFLHDIHLAASRNVRNDAENHAFPEENFAHVSVVAVHNGDFDSEALGAERTQLQTNLKRMHDVELEWWDANELTRLALLPVGEAGRTLEHEADATLFPPGVRPFVRLALDSLRVRPGGEFDLAWVDRLLNEALPLGRREIENDSAVTLSEGPAIAPLQLRRIVGELGVFVEMMIVESKALSDGLTLPALDTIERVIVRAMEHIRRIEPDRLKRERRHLRGLMQQFVGQYLRVATVLRKRLEPLRALPYSLSVASESEPIDYPLRALRLMGYLATAGLLALDANDAGTSVASEFAATLVDLWKTNIPACAGPVTDDQGIELGLIWELLLRLGRTQDVKEMTSEVVRRTLRRRELGLPFPTIRQFARVPMQQKDLRDLVEGVIGGKRSAIEERASTLLPLSLYLAHVLGIPFTNEDLTALQRARQTDDEQHEQCSIQSWQPPDDAAQEWYAHEIKYRGMTHVFQIVSPKDPLGSMFGVTTTADLATQFEQKAQPIKSSAAEGWELSAIDRIAWKLWRTPPPMYVFVKLVHSIRTTNTSHA
ncbi:hypothetical protein [Sorangium sp. So ce1024]|uniref:hypothetical protein n=1 Tax=Sorangium sp. So ce1024 TaxID=3133327 RepID=UPI003F0FBF05